MSKESLFRTVRAGAVFLALATACSSSPQESAQTDGTCSQYDIILPNGGATAFGDQNRHFEASAMSPGIYEVKLNDGIGSTGDGVIQRIEGISGAHILFQDDGGFAEIRITSANEFASQATVTDCLNAIPQPVI